MNIKQANKIYCVGIGGIGVSGLARLLLSLGSTVAGSDQRQSAITDDLAKLGIKIYIGQSEHDLRQFAPNVIVYSADVVNFNWPQEIPKMSQAQALGQLMEGKFGIGVTGTNGKSTTSALLGLILEKAELDPSVLIGSQLSAKNESDKFKSNARLGGSEYFVAESDEYARKMLENKPKMIVITNIAADHLDYYKDLNDIKSAFSEYIRSLGEDGILIYNADDHNAVEVSKHANCHKFTFGIHHYADLQAINVKATGGQQTFDLHLNDQMVGNITLNVPGLFNVSNALGAILAALKIGVKFDAIKTVIADYAGIWRRFERVGELDGAIVISDYAHHPDGISATIEAAKQFYPGKKILTVFQPHHRNRTQKLFGEFVDSLLKADDVIVPEIFDVSGREHGEEISSAQIVDELKKQQVNAVFVKNLDDAEKIIRERAKSFDLILMMGAGDIDLLARKLVE